MTDECGGFDPLEIHFFEEHNALSIIAFGFDMTLSTEDVVNIKNRLRNRKYSRSDKGKINNKKYLQTERGKQNRYESFKRYVKTKTGMKAMKRYQQSDKGKKAYNKASKKYYHKQKELKK